MAALLALAAELGPRSELLVTWRCGDVDGRARPKVGSRARADRHLRLVQPAPPSSPFETPEWHEFAGDDLAIPRCNVPTEALVLSTLVLDRTDVADIIRSAWLTLGRFNPDADDRLD